MPVRGTVKKGKVLLDNPNSLPEGTKVEVRRVKKRTPVDKVRKPAKKKAKSPPRSLTERLQSVIGKAKHLPPDASINHDYYLYGLPKQE